MSDGLLTTNQAAERAGLAPHILRAAIQQRRLPVQAERLATCRARRRSVRIAERDLEVWLASRQIKPPRPAGASSCAIRTPGRPSWPRAAASSG